MVRKLIVIGVLLASVLGAQEEKSRKESALKMASMVPLNVAIRDFRLPQYDKKDRKPTATITARLKAGHRLVIFPEGTSTDGRRVAAFKSTLFQPFMGDTTCNTLKIQAVSLCYIAPQGEDARYYGWWGDMTWGPHLLKILSTKRQGRVLAVYHPPVRAITFQNRKQIAKTLENNIRDALALYS